MTVGTLVQWFYHLLVSQFMHERVQNRNFFDYATYGHLLDGSIDQFHKSIDKLLDCDLSLGTSQPNDELFEFFCKIMKDKYRLGKELSFIHFVMVEHSFLFLLDVVHG